MDHLYFIYVWSAYHPSLDYPILISGWFRAKKGTIGNTERICQAIDKTLTDLFLKSGDIEPTAIDFHFRNSSVVERPATVSNHMLFGPIKDKFNPFPKKGSLLSLRELVLKARNSNLLSLVEQ